MYALANRYNPAGSLAAPVRSARYNNGFAQGQKWVTTNPAFAFTTNLPLDDFTSGVVDGAVSLGAKKQVGRNQFGGYVNVIGPQAGAGTGFMGLAGGGVGANFPMFSASRFAPAGENPLGFSPAPRNNYQRAALVYQQGYNAGLAQGQAYNRMVATAPANSILPPGSLNDVPPTGYDLTDWPAFVWQLGVAAGWNDAMRPAEPKSLGAAVGCGWY